MKNLLTQWELKKKTDLKLELSRLVLLSFLDRAIGMWPAALLFSAAGPSRQRSNHQGSEPSELEPSRIELWEVKSSWVGTIKAQAIVGAMSIKSKVALEDGRTTD